jgi:4-amino-4-deoxy-L-arabinose transferase-like glycosyltransferase
LTAGEEATAPLPAISRLGWLGGRFTRLNGTSVAVVASLGIGLVLRLYAAANAGTAVDEPIYRYIAAHIWQYGYPAIRPEAGQRIQPFLYHPPFVFYLLGSWMAIWNNDSLLSARMFSVCASMVMLLVLYGMAKSMMGSRKATVLLFLVAIDPWIVLTNQAVYIENSQMILILVAIWAYWKARVDNRDAREYPMPYLLAGLAIGGAIIYKNIGVYLVLVVLADLVLTRARFRRGQLYALAAASAVVVAYVLVMHIAFGSIFYQTTITQIRRTLGLRHSPGLNYGPFTAVTAIARTYWIFFVPIGILIAGAAAAAACAIRAVRQEPEAEIVLLSWALGAVVFAAGIALKSPHYLILWLIPLYFLIVDETPAFFAWVTQRRPVRIAHPVLVAGFAVVILTANMWTYQERFLRQSGDALDQAVAYINRAVPSSAIVATQNYIGVDIRPRYVPVRTTPSKLYRSHATYLALYWSLTEPIPKSLGDVVRYCVQIHEFSGFNDHAEVCRIVTKRLLRAGG